MPLKYKHTHTHTRTNTSTHSHIHTHTHTHTHSHTHTRIHTLPNTWTHKSTQRSYSLVASPRPRRALPPPPLFAAAPCTSPSLAAATVRAYPLSMRRCVRRPWHLSAYADCAAALLLLLPFRLQCAAVSDDRWHREREREGEKERERVRRVSKGEGSRAGE